MAASVDLTPVVNSSQGYMRHAASEAIKLRQTSEWTSTAVLIPSCCCNICICPRIEKKFFVKCCYIRPQSAPYICCITCTWWHCCAAIALCLCLFFCACVHCPRLVALLCQWSLLAACQGLSEPVLLACIAPVNCTELLVTIRPVF